MAARSKISIRDRFWRSVEMIPFHPCFEWMKGKTPLGYGNMRVGGRTTLAHRLSYELNKGQIPDGLFVFHSCDNPGCVRPEHLFVGANQQRIENQRRNKVELDISERLESFSSPEPNTGCILWFGSSTSQGYGTLSVMRKVKKAHRLSYERYIGPIPHGQCVCHRCDTPECINPKHLFLGTNKENIHDSIKKGRHVMAKHFSKLDMKQIKLEYKTGRFTQKELGKKYGTHQSNICRIVRGEYQCA